MKGFERVLIVFSLYAWATFLVWMTGFIAFFALPVLGLGYAVFGGKKHV